MVPAGSGGSLWQWAFETPDRLWVATSTPAGGVFCYQRAGANASWVQQTAFVIDSTQTLYSLQGRMEGGQFILYSSGSSRVLRANTVTLQVTVLATAPPNTHFRSVQFAPQGLTPATPSATKSNSPTNTGTPSSSQTSSSVSRSYNLLSDNEGILFKIECAYELLCSIPLHKCHFCIFFSCRRPL